MKIKWITISGILAAALILPLSFTGSTQLDPIARAYADEAAVAPEQGAAVCPATEKGYCPAYRWAAGRGWRRGGWRPYDGYYLKRYVYTLMWAVDLSEEQIAAIKATSKEACQADQAYRKAAHEAGWKLKKAVLKGDVEVTGKYADAYAAAIRDLAVSRTQYIGAIHAHLTAEQLAQIEGMKERWFRVQGGRKGFAPYTRKAPVAAEE